VPSVTAPLGGGGAIAGGSAPTAARGHGGGRRPRWLRVKDWDEHVEHLERMAATPGFLDLRDRVVELAGLRPEDRLLDVGAGTGLLTVAAAPRVARVSALDNSPAMCERLARKLSALGIGNAEVLLDGATALPFGDGTLDVVLSNYCFHHLTHTEKDQALAEIVRVLRPGGRLVFADMMFQVSVRDRRDRAVIARLARRMVVRGPAGLWRLARNATRIATGRWEHPARVEWWEDALARAGFAEVDVRALDHEGGIARARRPPGPGTRCAAP